MTEVSIQTRHVRQADDSSKEPLRGGYFEIWSRSGDGKIRKHGGAHGLTFKDACKHLACTSLDFWTHYERGHYRGLPLYETREQALGNALDATPEPSTPSTSKSA